MFFFWKQDNFFTLQSPNKFTFHCFFSDTISFGFFFFKPGNIFFHSINFLLHSPFSFMFLSFFISSLFYFPSFVFFSFNNFFFSLVSLIFLLFHFLILFTFLSFLSSGICQFFLIPFSNKFAYYPKRNQIISIFIFKPSLL